MSNLREMKESELLEISKTKNKKNVYTSEAIRAQTILWERHHIPETDYHRTYMDDFYGDRD